MNTLEVRRRLLGRNVYKKTVEGNPAIAQGSLARRYPGITMQGWTEQNGTPTPEAPVPIVSAGTQNQDTGKYEYEVKLTGKNLFNPEKLTGGEIVEYNGVQCYKYTDNSTNFTYVDDFAENTQYCFSVMVLSSEGNEEKATDIFIVYTDGTRSLIKISHNQLTNAVSSANKTVAMITGGDSWSAVRYIDLTTTTLGIGTEPLPFQPYKEQTVTLTADRQLTKWDKLEKRNGQWGWVYKSNEVVFDGSKAEAWGLYNNGFYIIGGLKDVALDTALCAGSLSDKFHYDGSEDHASFRYTRTGNSYSPIFYYNGIVDVESWRQFLAENNVSYLYPTEAETFIPLTETEQEQMNALYTFRPTTVMSNDCECNMSLTYKTKKSMVGGGNPYGLEIGGITGGGGGYEFEATNRIRTDYIPFYSPDGSQTYTIVGNPYNIANSTAYDNQKNALGTYGMTAGAFTPPAGTWFIRISFSKPDNSDFTQEELNQLIRTFDIERS